MMAQKARQIGKQKLLGLVQAAEACKSRMGQERQALGAKFEAAATSDNFNAKALRPLLPLLKMEAGPQAHLWRTMLLYADHLGIGAQGDLLDGQAEGDDEETEQEDPDQADIEDEVDPVDSVLAGMDVPEVGRFRTAMKEATTLEAVNRGLDRFSLDYPDHAENALAIATTRLEEINAEAGGGEDLRSTAQQEAEQQEVAETADAAKGANKRKRASTRKDAGKVGATHDASNVVAGEFGGGLRH